MFKSFVKIQGNALHNWVKLIILTYVDNFVNLRPNPCNVKCQATIIVTTDAAANKISAKTAGSKITKL